MFKFGYISRETPLCPLLIHPLSSSKPELFGNSCWFTGRPLGSAKISVPRKQEVSTGGQRLVAKIEIRILSTYWRRAEFTARSSACQQTWIRCLLRAEAKNTETVFRMGSELVCPDCQNKAPQAAWLKPRNLFSHSSGAKKSKIKGSAGMVSPEASLLSLQKATFSPRLHMVLPLYVSLSLL